MSRGPLLLLVASSLVALGPLGCNESSDCETACRRVSRCRQEARQGEKMFGEKDLPPDARCMNRCESDRQTWESCEYKQRSCDALRQCYGPLK